MKIIQENRSLFRQGF